MSATAPAAPGQLGVPARPAEMMDYLGRLDAWLRERRAELDSLDEQIVTTGRQAELTPDLTLALALWQAARTRQNLLLTTWDSGRVGREELERLSALIWGRLDTEGSTVVQLQSMAVSLPEAARLCDALVSQLRTRLNTDPDAEQQQLRLRDLRAQLERIRDQVRQEPPAFAQGSAAKLAALVARTDDITAKRGRGGDIGGLLGSLEADAARLERDLIVADAQRREGRDLLTRARDDLAQLTAREQAVRALADQVGGGVWPAPQVVVPSVAALGPLPNTRTALVGYLDALGRLGALLGQAQEALGRAAGDRDATTSLLDALQTKAVARGHGDDPILVDIAGLARRCLAEVPVAMPVLQQLLSAYSTRLDYLGKR